MRILLERLNSPIAVAVALVLFLVLDGFLLYRYQQDLQSRRRSYTRRPLDSSLGSFRFPYNLSTPIRTRGAAQRVYSVCFPLRERLAGPKKITTASAQIMNNASMV